MAGIFIGGWSFLSERLSSSQSKGVWDMADDPEISANIPGIKLKIGHREGNQAVAAILTAVRANPIEPVIVVGHSFGADTAIEIAQELERNSVCVDLLIQIDSVGIGDEVLPANVKRGVNLFVAGKESWLSQAQGTEHVEGSENIAIYGSTHTDIDENLRVKDLVRHYTSLIP